MRHLFIINPEAGQGEARDLAAEIEAVCSVAGLDYGIYETTAVGDAERFVRACCEEHCRTEGAEACEAAGAEPLPDAAGDGTLPDAAGAGALPPLRFYACGGDGTLNEVVNGAAGHAFAEVGCIPAGTGNDFVRNFPGGSFNDLIAQIRGEARPCDLIRYEGVCDGREVSRYCVNMFNIGFDCNVVDMTDRMKQKPMMNGSLAYLVSVFATLIRKKGADLRVEYPAGAGREEPAGASGEASAGANVEAPGDTGYVYDGKLLLISVANGCFCGGGIKGIPRAVTDDGVFDVSLIRNVSRTTFVKLFPKYMKGTHLSDPRLEDVIRYTHEQSLFISPNGSAGTMKLCVDGEIVTAGPVRFTLEPRAFRFIVPVKE